MSGFTVHLVPGSPFSRAVLMALIEKGAGFRLAPVAPGTLREPEHLARHPFGRIPVLEHDGFRVIETQAILRYLDRVLPEPALTPEDPRAAARMDEVLNVNDWYLFRDVAAVIGYQRVVRPRLFGLPCDEAAVAAVLPQAETVFAELAARLGDGRYLAGDAVSLADLGVAPQMDILSATPEWDALVGERGSLVEWLGRMQERPSFAATTWERVAALAAA
jgi:glutathione S-transferase